MHESTDTQLEESQTNNSSEPAQVGLDPNPGQPKRKRRSPLRGLSRVRATQTEATHPPASRADASGGLQLSVDWTRCDGHGLCAAAYGEQIGLDRWGFPEGVTTSGVTVPESQVRAARLAVSACPLVALRLRTAVPQ
mgnify:CR=1 FL=1